MCVIASEGLPPRIALLLLSHCFIHRYRHPLFPLMAMFFEKCEQATQTPDCPSSDCFDVDIQAFVLRQEQEHKAFFSDDPELDGLVCITRCQFFLSTSSSVFVVHLTGYHSDGRKTLKDRMKISRKKCNTCIVFFKERPP